MNIWGKLYFVVLAVAIILTAFFMLYAWSWLQSIGLPADAAAGADYHAGYSSSTIWLSSIVLLIIANALLWTRGRVWAMWATFLYFSVFIIAQYFWLESSAIRFKEQHGLAEHHIFTAPIAAALLVIAAAAIVYFNKFLVIRLHSKTYPPPEVVEVPATEDDTT